MNLIKQVLGGDLRRYTMALALVVIVAAFQILTSGRLLTSQNILNLLVSNTYVFVLAMGMLMVIVVGHIDLSVGSVAGLVAMITAMAWKDASLPWWIAIILGLCVGAVVGVWQGFWLAKMGIPGFITTLAGWMMFRGAVIWISKSVTRGAPPQLKWLGSGYLSDWGRGATGLNMLTVLIGAAGIVLLAWGQLRGRRKIINVTGEQVPLMPVVIRIALIGVLLGALTFMLAHGKPNTSIPVPTLIVIILIVFYSTLTQRTPYGRHIYAVGGAKAAAALSGVSLPKTYFLTMFNMSCLAAVAGLLMAGRLNSAGSQLGVMWELDAIASVFIGGAAVTGGIGTVGATIIGALVMGTINSGFFLMGVGSDKSQVIKGLVLLAAVAIDVFNKRQGRASISGRLFPGKTEDEESDDAGAVDADAAAATT